MKSISEKVGVFFLSVGFLLMSTSCGVGADSSVTTMDEEEFIIQTEDSESTTNENQIIEVVEYGDTIQVCWEMQELDAWVSIDPGTAGQHAIMEIGKEIEFSVSDSTTQIDGIDFDISDHFVTNVTNSVLGKKVGETVVYTEELEGRNYQHVFTITGINDGQVPSYCLPEDWEYQLKVSRKGNFFLANGATADTGAHYGFVDKVTGSGTVWGDNLIKYYTNTTASSILIPQGNGEFTNSPFYTTTNDRNLTWSEGVDGYGITECVEIKQMYLGKEADVLTFNELCIVNGYAENEKKWSENNRVKSLNLYYCDHLMA